MGKKKKSDEPQESKEDKFERLCKKRMANALKHIAYVGNCFTASYSWTPEQAAKVSGTLLDAVTKVEAASRKAEKETQDFEF